jgi:uncharacterized phage protein (TIGR01671 family)
MREYKFRAWDKKTKKLYPVELIRFYFSGIDQNGQGGAFLTDCEKDIGKFEEIGDTGFQNFNEQTGIFRNFNEIELMQYTGLKDKNGKEIYKGDIVEINCGTYKDNAVVNFIDGTFTTHDRGFEPDIMPPEKDMEIIGNIYENPELLKAK